MVNAVKVFKKTAPNGKITVYLGRRDFIDNTVQTEPVDGVVIVDNDYLRGRKVYAAVTVTYRYGREEDEVMGVNFSKEFRLVTKQIYPQEDKLKLTDVQDRLVKKLGANTYPFSVEIPETSPVSVQLQTEGETTKPLGVIYDLRVFASDNGDEKPHKRNSVGLAVRKVQFSPNERGKRLPSTLVSKGFALSSGKLNLEVTLDKDVYYHTEQVAATLNISNGSKKTVKHMKCSVIQHIELTMTNTHFTREVASLESKEGCPITPGSNLSKAFQLTPMIINKNKGGIALDGKVKDSDANLASSTLVNVNQNASDALGIVVSYSVRVKLNCGTLGGELVADLPFKLMHPSPGSGPMLTKMSSVTGEDNIVFEEFAKLRRGMSVEAS